MNQSGVSIPEPIIVGVAAVTLIETAARDLEDFNEEHPDSRPLALVGPIPKSRPAWPSAWAAGA